MNCHQLDARRLLCPLPVIRVQEKMKQLSAGEILEVTCTDPGVLQDIPAWCRVHGHVFLTAETHGREILVRIKVNDGPSL